MNKGLPEARIWIDAIKEGLPEALMKKVYSENACRKLLSLIKEVSNVLERNEKVVKVKEEKLRKKERRCGRCC